MAGRLASDMTTYGSEPARSLKVATGKYASVLATTGSPTITNYTSGGVTYDVYKWTASGSVTLSAGIVDALIVGGGGNGDTSRGGSGGGIIPATLWFGDGALTVTVGAGGTNAGAGYAAAGKPSSIGSVTTGLANGYNAGNNVGAAGTGVDQTLGYVSSITGSSLTYARAAQSTPAANSGDGGTAAGTIAGADGVVILRIAR